MGSATLIKWWEFLTPTFRAEVGSPCFRCKQGCSCSVRSLVLCHNIYLSHQCRIGTSGLSRTSNVDSQPKRKTWDGNIKLWVLKLELLMSVAIRGTTERNSQMICRWFYFFFFLQLQSQCIILPSVSFLKPVELLPDLQEALRQNMH